MKRFALLAVWFVIVCVFCFSLASLATADDGTYSGQIRHGDGWYNVTTTFDGDTGTFKIADGTVGTLQRLGTYPYGQIAGEKLQRHLYQWSDHTGKGLLWVCFRGKAFEGDWSKPGTNWASARWNGHLQAPTPPADPYAYPYPQR